MRKCLVMVLAMVLVGCGSSAVPTLTPADLSAPRMEGLEPRTIAIAVQDERPVVEEDRLATEERVLRALNLVFDREGIAVTEDSPNRLMVGLQRPSASVGDMDPETCVEMVGRLKFGDGRSMKVSSLGCAEVRNGFGMSYGGHVSGAFQYAAETLLTQIGQIYEGANDPLVFDASKIKIPPFADEGVNMLALSVVDEYSDNGTLGENLLHELTKAMIASGISVDEAAKQTLKLTLSQPSEDFGGRDQATCIALESRAELARGTVVGSGTSCRGLAEAGHHKILSDTLEILQNEYAKLNAK